jgi:dTDP-4-amino-4,6-dideoxygalactose transaminase
VVAKDPGIGQRAREFHRIGLVRDRDRFRIQTEGAWHQEVHSFGVNYRLPDIACALGLSQLARLTTFTQRRAELTARYNAALSAVDGVRTPVQRPDVEPAWPLYSVRILDGRRREVFDKMRAADIGVQVNYLPVYWHPVYADLGYRRGLCPNAEAFYAEQLSLPMFPDLTDDQVDHVVETLISILR